MKKLFAICAVLASAASGLLMAEATRQDGVSERGADVMPFSLAATTHVFTATPTGGTQQIVAKNPKDGRQVRLVRRHLQGIAKQFSKGDFSGPAHIHGTEMPGLAELERAKPSEIKISYTAMESGGQVTFTTANPALVTALHEWFDAQLSDHGSDAMTGHDHQNMRHHHEAADQ